MARKRSGRPTDPGPRPDPSPPLVIVYSSEFRRDVKRLAKGGKDMGKLTAVADTLRERRPLAEAHRDHRLTGALKGFRECHIEPDWLLIYRVDGDALELARTGSHAELFGK